MSLFHFKIELLPAAYFSGGRPATLSGNDIDRGNDEHSGWWAMYPPSDRLLEKLRALLPKNESWGDVEEYVSPKPHGSDIRIWKDEAGRVSIISFRYSLGADDWSLMERFITIAREENCLLVVEGDGGAVMNPEAAVVLEEFKKSRAMRFFRDPSAGLEGGRRLER